jgi:type IV pilus assembly protein PilV
MLLIKRNGAMRRSGRQSVRGVSLLEVLISILLSAIGLLALAGGNVASIRYSKMSQYRGTSTMLANDLAERIRANKAGLASYDYTASDFAGQSGAIAQDVTCETYAANAGAGCGAVALATYDLNTWRRIVRSQLPDGSVYVSVVSAVGATGCGAACVAADVWIAWRDPAVAAPDENSTDSNNSAECPNALNLNGDKSIRCSFFRINL